MPEDKLEVSQRVTTLLTQGLNSQARAEIENLLRDWPGDAEVFTLAGDVYAWTGAPSTAYRHYNSAADTYNRLGMPDKMLSVHHKILELDPSLLDANTQLRIRLLELLVAAEDALIAGKYENSVASYQEAIRQFPNHTVTYQRLASLFTRMGRPADAVLQYLTVARAFQQHGVTAKAAPYFERVLEIEPSNIEAINAFLAFLEKEGRQAEAEKPVKAAVQSFLEHGEVERASEFFMRLPESVQQDVTPLRAALLLQIGDVQQAEDAASMLELSRPEVADWFKRMGRVSLDRGDSVTADVYFRWASSQAAAVAPAPAAPPQHAPQPVAAPAPPPPQYAPQPMAVPAPPAPPPPMAVPATPTPQPMVAPAPPSPQFAPQPVAVAVPPPPPPPPPAPVVSAPAPLVQFVAPLNSDAIDIKAEDDRVVLQTMGEMCLAEEMFEEAKQVFERLLRAEPHRKGYLELLNKSRAGLGLGPVTGPPPLPGAIPPPPPPPRAPSPPAPAAATTLGAPAFQAPVLAPRVMAPPPPPPAPVVMAPPPPPPAPVVMAPPPPPAPVVMAPPPPPAPVVMAPPPPPPAPVVMAPPPPPPAPVVMAPPPPPPPVVMAPPPPPAPVVMAPPPPPPAPVVMAPPPPPTAPAVMAPPPPLPPPVAEPVVAARVPAAVGAGLETPDGSKIVRTSHIIPLGELPPATSSRQSFDDDIIE